MSTRCLAGRTDTVEEAESAPDMLHMSDVDSWGCARHVQHGSQTRLTLLIITVLAFLLFTRDLCFVSSISGIGVQCCKRQEVKDSLTKREQIRVDPFSSEYIHSIT